MRMRHMSHIISSHPLRVVNHTATNLYQHTPCHAGGVRRLARPGRVAIPEPEAREPPAQKVATQCAQLLGGVQESKTAGSAAEACRLKRAAPMWII